MLQFDIGGLVLGVFELVKLSVFLAVIGVAVQKFDLLLEVRVPRRILGGLSIGRFSCGSGRCVLSGLAGLSRRYLYYPG